MNPRKTIKTLTTFKWEFSTFDYKKFRVTDRKIALLTIAIFSTIAASYLAYSFSEHKKPRDVSDLFPDGFDTSSEFDDLEDTPDLSVKSPLKTNGILLPELNNDKKNILDFEPAPFPFENIDFEDPIGKLEENHRPSSYSLSEKSEPTADQTAHQEAEKASKKDQPLSERIWSTFFKSQSELSR